MAEEEVGVKFGAKTGEFDAGAKKVVDDLKGVTEETQRTTRGFSNLNAGLASVQRKMQEANKEYVVNTEAAQAYLSKQNSLTSSFSNLSFSTAGARRELIVLGHEVVSGNFSRIPGSLMVLAERMGGVAMSTLGFGAAIGIAGYTLYSVLSSIEEAKEKFNQLNAVLEAQGRAKLDVSFVKEYVETLSSLPGINDEAAQSIVSTFATASNVSAESFQKLTGVVRDFAYVTNTDAATAAKNLAKMAEDPARAADQLAEKYNNILTPAEYDHVQSLSAQGDKMGAVNIIAEALERRMKGLADEGMTPAQHGAHLFGEALSWLGDRLNEALNPIPPLTAALGHLADAWHGLFGGGEEKKKVDSGLDAALNKPILEALQLRQKMQNSLDEEARLKKQLETVTQGYNNASVLGMTEQADKLKETRDLIQAKIDKIEQLKLKEKERADKERERELQEEARKEEHARREQQRLAREAAQLKDNQLQGMQRVQKEKGTTAEDNIRLQFDARKITLDEEYAYLKQNYAQQYQEDLKLMQQRRSLWQQGSTEWNRVTAEMQTAHEDLQQNIIKLERQRIQQQKQIMREYEQEQKRLRQEEEQEWRGSVNTIVGGFSAGIKGMITQQDTLLRATGRVVEGLLSAFLGYFERKAELWLMDQILGQTTASTEAFGSIMSDAARAGAAAYASTAAIPIVGPALAPAAGAQAYATTAAYTGMLALDTGTNYVPGDMTAKIHEGERVVPRADNEQLIKAVQNGTGQRGGDTYVIKAMDSQDVKRFLRRNKKSLVKQGARALRGGGRVAYAGE